MTARYPNRCVARSVFGGLLAACALAISTTSMTPAVAQTNAAAQAVRQRVQGLDRAPEGDQPPPAGDIPSRRGDLGGTAPPAEPATGSIDMTYVPASAVAIVVIRPAQLMNSPLAQLLPVEVASAAAVQHIGFDPAHIDDIVAYYSLPPDGYGLAAKFNQPFKGSAIPAALRGPAKVGELAGRKYLQSPEPTKPSFFAPNARTLVVTMPDRTLRQLVESPEQAKSGPVVDRIANVPAGNDIYVAVDVAGLLPLLGPLQANAQNLPPMFQQYLEIPNLVTAIEFTGKLSAPSPFVLEIHANDDASAEQLETLIPTGIQLLQGVMQARMAAQIPADDPVAMANMQYMQRMGAQQAENMKPVRDGAKLTFFRAENEAEREKQLMQLAFGLGMIAGKFASDTAADAAFPGQEFQMQMEGEAGAPAEFDQPRE